MVLYSRSFFCSIVPWSHNSSMHKTEELCANDKDLFYSYNRCNNIVSHVRSSKMDGTLIQLLKSQVEDY